MEGESVSRTYVVISLPGLFVHIHTVYNVINFAYKYHAFLQTHTRMYKCSCTGRRSIHYRHHLRSAHVLPSRTFAERPPCSYEIQPCGLHTGNGIENNIISEHTNSAEIYDVTFTSRLAACSYPYKHRIYPCRCIHTRPPWKPRFHPTVAT